MKIKPVKKEENKYDSIEIFKGLQGIRRKPEMYLGSVESGDALNHILWEGIDNAVDEVLNGHGDKIIVKLWKDGSASVEDFGRGVPCSMNKEEKKSNLELALTLLHAGGKFNNNAEGGGAYKYSSGTHGLGISCSNAVSEKFIAVVYRDGFKHTIEFRKGEKVGELEKEPYKGNRTGTIVRMYPDKTIFKNITEFEGDKIKSKLRELCFLCSNLSVQYINEKTKEDITFNKEDDISTFIKYLTNHNLTNEPIILKDTIDNIMIEIALSWVDNLEIEEEICKCYTNNIINIDGGTHLMGFRNGLTRTINNYIEASDLPKTMKIQLPGEPIREGMISIISLRHPDPKYASQTKMKLVSQDATQAVANVVSTHLQTYLEQNPVVAKRVVNRCVNAYKALLASRKAKEAYRKADVKSGILLPGKLADCQVHDETSELFIVEGQSAGGSCKMGRDRRMQAILPLKGKILNIEKADFKRMMASEELICLVSALGTNLGKNFEINKLRYNKIILMTDGDVDGSHLRALLLTFFFRQMPQLIQNGHLYIAQPPLFRIDLRGSTYYLKNEHALKEFIKEKKLNKNNIKLSRYKGLGEMACENLWTTTMCPESRTLLQVKIEDLVEADKIFTILMGDQVEPRREFIFANSDLAKLDV